MRKGACTMSGINSFSCFAAKSGGQGSGKWLPVWMHASDAAAVMEYLCASWLPSRTVSFLQEHGVPDVLSLTKFLAYVHDIGKITNAFQVKISRATDGLLSDLANKGVFLCSQNLSGEVSHATAGEILLRALRVPGEIASVVGSHHGRPALDGDNCLLLKCYSYDFLGDSNRNDVVGLWKRAESDFFKWALRESGLTVNTLPRPDVDAQIILSGLLIMADWIASNSWLFPLIPCGTYGFAVDYERRKERAFGRLRLPSRLESVGFAFDESGFLETFGFPMNEVQKMVFDMVSQTDDLGLVILEAPMGAGKTEAALALSNVLMDGCTSCGGLYFGLPTQATANGIFPRLKDWSETKCLFDSQTIVLAHENASLNLDYRVIRKSGEDASDSDGMLMRHDFFSRSKLTFLADFVIGTIDQLLVSGLKQKHFMLRHLGLISKVVIVDEVHAYDARMMTFLNTVLSWLGAYHVPVVLLSATLPSDRRSALVAAYQRTMHLRNVPSDVTDWMTTQAYPLLTYTSGKHVYQRTCSVKNLRKLSVKVGTLPERQLIDAIKPVVQNGGCVAVIVNSVRLSQKLAADLQQGVSDADVILVHSAFTAEHRARLESDVLSRLGKNSGQSDRKGVILVGTQVLEQSLDYDVDLMISEICPMDLLLQRMGRLWRHAIHDAIRGAKEPKFFILEPTEIQHGTAKIYAPYLLRRTKEEIPCSLSLPNDISSLVQRVYDCKGHETDEDCIRWQISIKKDVSGAEAVTLKYTAGLSDWHNLLNIAVKDSAVDMSVRNTGVSITPVCLFKCGDGIYRTLDGTIFDTAVLPSEDETMMLLSHRMPLIYKLVNPFEKARSVTEELIAMSAPFADWQSHINLLENVLFCVFDETGRVTLGGLDFEYHEKFGFLEKGVMTYAI